jgi:hypothetical protein
MKHMRLFFTVLFLSLGFALSMFAQQNNKTLPGAPPNAKLYNNIPAPTGKVIIKNATPTAVDSFETTVYTYNDLTVFSYFDDTEVRIYNQGGSLLYQYVLPTDSFYNVSPGGGIYRLVANKSFTILVGDAVTNYVNGYFAVDEAGKGTSLKLNTWMMTGFNGSQDEFVVFSYNDNTGFTIKDLASKQIIYAGTLNKGKYFSSRQAGILSSMYHKAIQVTGTLPVSVLSYTDQDYYCPSGNGTFAGTDFLGYSAYEGSWENSITITSYADNNKVTIKNIDSGSVIDTVTLMRGQVYTRGVYMPTYWEVISQGTVTTANIPYAGWSGSYAYMARSSDESGTCAGKLFYVPTISSNLQVFSYEDNNTITITQLGLYTDYPYTSTQTVIYTGTLAKGGVYSFQSPYGDYVYKIEGTGRVAVLQSSGGFGADFMPLSYAASLPDLTLSVNDINFSVADSVYVPGDKIKVNIIVHNAGAVNAENVPVVVYDGDPDIGNAAPVANSVLSEINAGGSGQFSFDYVIPLLPQYHSLVVKIDPDNVVVESNKSNNKAQRFLRANKDLLPPLSVNVTAPSALELVGGVLTPNPFTVRYDIFNTGSVSASTVAIDLVLAKGLTLASGTLHLNLGNIPANGTVAAIYSVNANKDSNGFNNFTATITASNAPTKVIFRAINIPDNVPPAAPTGFHAANNGKYSASFYWTANTEKDLGGYYLYYTNDSTNWSGTGANQGSSPLLIINNVNYVVTGLPLTGNLPTNYWFKLKAFDLSSNLSGDSNPQKLLIQDSITAVTDRNEIPKTFNLSQNYPNPFNPETMISYQIPVTGYVTLKIYNVLGKEIATLVNETKQPGNYAVRFNGKDLASGIYFYQLQSGTFSHIKKLVLMK